MSKPNRSDPHWSEYHWKFLTALARHGGIKHAQVIKQAVTQMIERIPDKSPFISKEYLTKLYDSLTDEEKKHPEK